MSFKLLHCRLRVKNEITIIIFWTARAEEQLLHTCYRSRSRVMNWTGNYYSASRVAWLLARPELIIQLNLPIIQIF